MTFESFDEIPRGRYGVIYADPPWHYETYSDKGTDRGACQHYRILLFDQIAAFPVADLAAKDCVLILWIVRSNMSDADRLIKAWNFVKKSTAFVWEKTCKNDPMKPRIGLGKWTRTGVEQSWLATRGKPRRLSAAVRELIIAPIREHSQKPDEIYERIETLVAGPYLELFARQKWPGWDSFGDGIPGWDSFGDGIGVR